MGKSRPTVHMVLTYHWYDEIASGRKQIEYRKCNAYWKRRLGTFPYPQLVVFRRGYTSTIMTRRIRKITRGECPIPGWDGEYYQVHLDTYNTEM